MIIIMFRLFNVCALAAENYLPARRQRATSWEFCRVQKFVWRADDVVGPTRNHSIISHPTTDGAQTDAISQRL